jgi:hypothetical protein
MRHSVTILLSLLVAACTPQAVAPANYPPYPPYPAYADYPAYPAYPGATPSAQPAPAPGHHKLGANAVTDRWSYLAGTSGTATIGAGQCVLAAMAYATSAATATIAPGGPAITTPTTGPTITIPASVGWTPLGLPATATQQLCDGTVFTWTGTAAYWIALERYNP